MLQGVAGGGGSEPGRDSWGRGCTHDHAGYAWGLARSALPPPEVLRTCNSTHTQCARHRRPAACLRTRMCSVEPFPLCFPRTHEHRRVSVAELLSMFNRQSGWEVEVIEDSVIELHPTFW